MATIAGFRFLKFGIVGATGAVVNLAGLWMGQEYLFAGVQSQALRVNLSLLVAITLATFNNYCWNRRWTWRDRKTSIHKGFWMQMAEYYAVCWVAIALQLLLTNVFVQFMHYLPANVVAIGLTAVINFLANDAWTFSIRRLSFKRATSLDRLQSRATHVNPCDCDPY
jgi:dolichol-phosphate mannosyltransferase